MKQIAIVGASGHGSVIADLAVLCGYKVLFFDDAYPQKQSIKHWPIQGTIADLIKLKDDYKQVVVAIGNNQIRLKLCKQLIAIGFDLPVFIHPKAAVSQYAEINSGTVVFAGAVINAFAKIGKYCIINTCSIVEHDCILGDAVHLSPNVALAGGVKIGDLSWLGIGSNVIQGIQIGEEATVGAGSVVINNVLKEQTVVGIPAKVIEKS